MNEAHGAERRVAMTPDAVMRLEKKLPGVKVLVEAGAGMAAGFTDAAYEVAGAVVIKDFAKNKADVVLRITQPERKAKLPLNEGGVLVTLTSGNDAWAGLTESADNVLALEKLPRTSRAQAMDVLSSQANLGGYAAVLGATQYLPRLMPMLMTSAGSSKPAQVLVLGVGVAGLQAIATARRLGAQVKAFDVRPEVSEQIMSLGAKPVVLNDPSVAVEGKGGYAGAMDEEGMVHLQNLLAPFIAEADVVVSTAQVPGRAAPVLIGADILNAMKPGSVIVDMAAGGYNKAHGVKGGNCPLSKADEVVIEGHGISILGETNWTSTVAGDASRFWAQNMVNLLGIIIVDGKMLFDDELATAMLVVKDGKVAQ
ncbi:MAG: NAD(P)(+) transhydrogenase (Re/Si-specific) subunit alpha [Alphaproteobacteria bacterium]|nr:MAG: NAD(P)(+) transhydrogenase (Re/Si-specific) subunit alpha [Alphaproteobacteria bacterium]